MKTIKYNIEVEVPEGEYCFTCYDDRCSFVKRIRLFDHKCVLFNENLLRAKDKYKSLKCKECLERSK